MICVGIGAWDTPIMADWCTQHCNMVPRHCPESQCGCTGAPPGEEPSTTAAPTTPEPTEPTTVAPTTGNPGQLSCEGVGAWNTPAMADWCNTNCNHVPKNCPATHCVCNEEAATTTTEDPDHLNCEGVGVWNTPAMAEWCTSNCNHVPSYCPASHCICNEPMSK